MTASRMSAGKLVSQLFGKVQDMLEGDHSLLFILIDEAGVHDAAIILACQHGACCCVVQQCMHAVASSPACSRNCGAAAG
jgi:hypothetical protein